MIQLPAFAATRTQTFRRVATTLLLTLSLTAVARADFSTGFETSSGSYASGSTILGVHDTGLSGTATWSAIFGAPASSVMITNNSTDVQSGTQALQLVDASATTAYGVSYNLAGAVNYTQSFTVHFGLNVVSYGGGGSPVQFYLGANTAAVGSQPYWFAGNVDSSGNINFWNDSTNGTTATQYSLGSYTSISTLGQYISFDITIDPTQHKFTSVVLSGTQGTFDKTSVVQATNGGEIPWLRANGVEPSAHFDLIAGTGGTAVVDLDNLSVSNVPEPTTLALMFVSSLVLIASARRRTAAALVEV